MDYIFLFKGEGMKKQVGCFLLLAVFFTMQPCTQAGTIASFADPAFSASTPLFTVDAVNHVIKGGWSDSMQGLNLDMRDTSKIFVNAFFTVSDLAFTGTASYGTTGAGTIKFFANGADPQSAAPIYQIDFQHAAISLGSLSADDIFSSDGITFGGSELAGKRVCNGTFSFAFANLAALPDKSGFTATAAFTSSEAPEPATLLLLGAGFVFATKLKR
jgi:hypothetical protein